MVYIKKIFIFFICFSFAPIIWSFDDLHNKTSEVVNLTLPGTINIISGQQLLGCGFVFDGKEGFAVTNKHVIVEENGEIKANGVEQVIFPNGKTYPAELVKLDKYYDIALIKIKTSEQLPEIPLVKNIMLVEGEPVVIIGMPQGLTYSVITGKIGSGNYDDYIISNHLNDRNLIHCLAEANFGNSGSPIINLEGNAIGILYGGVITENSVNDQRLVLGVKSSEIYRLVNSYYKDVYGSEYILLKQENRIIKPNFISDKISPLEFNNAVVKIEGPSIKGIGVIIKDKNMILTSLNLVKNDFKVYFLNGTEIKTEIYKENQNDSWVLLKMLNNYKNYGINLASEKINLGEKIFLVSKNEAGISEPKIKKGIVSSVNRNLTYVNSSKKSIMQVSISFDDYELGAPILNLNRELIGITLEYPGYYASEKQKDFLRGIGFVLPVTNDDLFLY